MSHTSVVKDILFTDIQALRAAVAELNKMGVKCQLLENAIPRAFFTGQKGLETSAPYVLKLEDGRFDVGFYPVQGKSNTFEARADFWGNHIGALLGEPQEEGVPMEVAALAKLRRMYGVSATELAYARRGIMTRRSVKSDGSVQLIATFN